MKAIAGAEREIFMQDHRDYRRVQRKKQRIRWLLSVLTAFLVVVGSLTALFLVYRGLSAPGRSHGDPSIPIPDSTTIISPAAPDATASTQPLTESTAQPDTDPVEVDTVQTLLDSMDLDEKICQLFIVTPEALSGTAAVTEAPEHLDAALRQYPVGGIVLFSQNLLDEVQCQKLLSAYQNASRIPLLTGVDEEGGLVSRLGSKEAMNVPDYPPMGTVGASGNTDDAYAVGQTLGDALKRLGFNLDFAPVADVNTNPDNPVIGTRAFSSSPETAAQMVSACVRGFVDADTICCLKHFPGHGDTAEDSHSSAATTYKTLEQLTSAEFLPFASGIAAGAPMVMVGHISVPAVTGDHTPATLSSTIVTGLLREQLGFEGVIVTDAMNMQAVSSLYPAGEAAVLALCAGCDMILMPDDLPAAINAVRDALTDGRLSAEQLDASVIRILKLKLEYGILSANE